MTAEVINSRDFMELSEVNSARTIDEFDSISTHSFQSTLCESEIVEEKLSQFFSQEHAEAENIRSGLHNNQIHLSIKVLNNS